MKGRNHYPHTELVLNSNEKVLIERKLKKNGTKAVLKQELTCSQASIIDTSSVLSQQLRQAVKVWKDHASG